jgi:C-terminal processing protease CtpA/Prc
VGSGARQTICIEPRGKPRYKGRIFLLTSGLTASAAEIFVLALLQRPDLTRIGEHTLGEQSDVMERHLPNGWQLHLSNELYHASDDETYEDRGVPPHVGIPYLDLHDIEAGRDPMLDFVLAQP